MTELNQEAATSEPLIRPARESDFDDIAAAIRDWWDLPGFDSEAAKRERAALVPRLWLQHFCDTSFVAHFENDVAGFLIGFLSPARPREGYIHFVGVNPGQRRLGLGRRLYGRFFELCTAAGRDTVRAITSPQNTRSIAFHQAVGFSVDNPDLPEKSDYDGPSLHRVTMTAILRSDSENAS